MGVLNLAIVIPQVIILTIFYSWILDYMNISNPFHKNFSHHFMKDRSKFLYIWEYELFDECLWFLMSMILVLCLTK